MFEIKKEPRLEWMDALGALLIYVGSLLFLVGLHVLSIDNTGGVAEVFSTAFIVGLIVYVALVIFGFVGLVVHLLRWLTWTTSTAFWKKEKLKGK